jgi:preprotein translocase subunit SecE
VGFRSVGEALEFRPARAYLPPDASIRTEPMATKANPFQFIQQVRAEVAKVVWPTRREVLMTSVMVFIMTLLTAAFFFLVDLIIRTGLTYILTMFG